MLITNYQGTLYDPAKQTIMHKDPPFRQRNNRTELENYKSNFYYGKQDKGSGGGKKVSERSFQRKDSFSNLQPWGDQ